MGATMIGIQSDMSGRRPPNPFLYKSRVPPERFIGRKQEVSIILDRLVNPNNQGGSAISGPKGIGKTSLLQYLGSPYASQMARELVPERVHFVNIPIDTMVPFEVLEFWDYLFSDLAQWPANQFKQQAKDLLIMLEKGPPRSCHPITSFFESMGKTQLVVVLLDNFDRVLGQIRPEAIRGKRNKEQAEYLNFLGAIAAILNLPAPRGFSLIVASEQPVYDLLSGHQSVAFGSAFYNNMLSIPLRSLSEAECIELLDTYLEGTEINFVLDEREELYRNSSFGHPWDFQEAAFKLFERKLVQFEEERSKTVDPNVTAWAWGVVTQATTLLFTEVGEILKEWREKRQQSAPPTPVSQPVEPIGEAPIADADTMMEALQQRAELAAQEMDIKTVDSLMTQIKNRRKKINDFRTELSRMQTVETKLWLEDRIEEEQGEVAEAAEEMRQILERLSGRPVRVEGLEIT